jgi:oligosaccharide translocation protein RFT1
MCAGSQLGARILTFVLNLVAARLLRPEEYGISAVQFHLINSSIVFLSREGVRRSCLRISGGGDGARANTDGKYRDDNVLYASYVAIPIGLVVTGIATLLLVYFTKDPGYQQAAVVQCAAALLEIMSEPFYILSTSRMWFGIRTTCEAVSSIVKNIVSVWLLVTDMVDMSPMMAMSMGQLAYGASLLVFFAASFACYDDLRNYIIIPKIRGVAIDPQFFPLYTSFSLQALGKLVLAEGSKAVLAVVTSPQVQGVYGLVNNLGSLVVRTLFQPYEEIVFVSFSKQEAVGQDKKGLQNQALMLSTLCQVICIIGGLSACFGPAYSYVALRILYGETWASTDAPTALGLYSVYVALLALNGTLEAFLHGVADKKFLNQNNIVLIGTSLLHMALSIAAVKIYGAPGLLFADGINMILRIGYCFVFMKGYFALTGGLRAVRDSVNVGNLHACVTSLSGNLFARDHQCTHTRRL